MSITVFVTTLNDDKSLGATDNRVIISENLNKFRIQGVEPGNDIAALVFQAGRYIAVVGNDADNKTTMTFIDLKNDETFAKFVASHYTEDLQIIFMKNFYELSKTYKQNYNSVNLELADGKAFSASAN